MSEEPSGDRERRESDRLREMLLREKDAEIARLAKRVETLVQDRVTTQQLTQVTLQAQDQGRALIRFEHALFGVDGSNGLNSKVRDLYGGLHELRDALQGMREEEFHDLKASLEETRGSIRHWAIGLVPVFVAVIGAVAAITAALH